ncbi:MAG: glycohydrolase toxin TNT-related protein, partial [Bacteroidota bacterium]
YGPDGRQLVWPPMNGGYNVEFDVNLAAGTVLDRYAEAWEGLVSSGNPKLGGSFFSPLDPSNNPYNYAARALKAAEADNVFYFKVTLQTNLLAERATVIPWFGQPGNGVQVRVRMSPNITEFAENGGAIIEIISSPSANTNALPFVNTTIQQ